MKIILLYIVIFISNSYKLILTCPTITSYRYYNKSISINNIVYRDSIATSLEKSLFTIKLDAGIWNINNKPFYSYKGNLTCSKYNFKDYLIIKNKNILIDSLVINSNYNSKYILISTSIILKKHIAKNNINILIYIPIYMLK